MTTLLNHDLDQLPIITDWMSLLSETGDDTIILTPNKRLAATLHQLYREQQLATQERCWHTPVIIPISSWLETLYTASLNEEHITAPPMLLNAQQSDYLWKKIVLEHKELQGLIQGNSTAKLMQSAWSLLINWQLNLTSTDCEDYQDYLLLLSCIEQYELICNENHWLDQVMLPRYVLSVINNCPAFLTSLPKQILLAGFNELPPMLLHFIQQLQKNQLSIALLALEKKQNTAYLIEAHSDIHEYQLMAHWAKSLYEKNNSTRIVCVVPNLADVRDKIKKTFEEVFFADNQYCFDKKNMPFNISAGTRLSQHGIIKIALHLLSLRYSIISAEQLSTLLYSSYLGDYYAESSAREKYALLIKKHNLHRMTLYDNNMPFHLSAHCPLLFNRMHAALEKIQRLPDTQTIGAWLECFNVILQLYGWPGEKSLNSELFQITDAWLQLFYKLASIEKVAGPMTYGDALALLSDFTENTVFQVKSPLTSIQILGTLEATGMPVDYIWLAGLDDITWPPKPNPHPFIPKKIQSIYQMPHASSIREYQYCKQLLEQFKMNSTLLICSYASMKDQLPRYVSPLLYGMQHTSAQRVAAHLEHSNFSKVASSKKFTYFQDEKGPLVDKKMTLKGGAHAIKAQSNCPFKGFAEWRLFLRNYAKPKAVLQSTEKGLILHQAMALIWGQIQNHATLCQLSSGKLNRIISKSIKDAMIASGRLHLHYRYYLRIEKKRLFRLIKNWLMLEQARPPFVVAHIEQQISASIADLQFTFRIDRVDQLENGKQLIIDYKSSVYHHIADWFSKRPTDPQLLVYLLSQQDHCHGISFAQINWKDSMFKGISQEDINIRGIKSINTIQPEATWQAQLQVWREIIEQLCQEFASGDARVLPVKLEATCSQCSQQPFCRIKETLQESTYVE